MMIEPGWKIYRGMIVGEHTRDNDLEINLLKGKSVTAPKKLADGTPFFASKPILIKAANVKTVVAAGDAKVADLCTGAVKAACAKNGIK